MTYKAGYTPGWELKGRNYADERSISMTETSPPLNYRWTSRHCADYQNNPPSNPDHEIWKALRLSFLDSYELVVTEEGKYRVWRWLGANSTGPTIFNGRSVIWSERRLLSDPIPLTPGLYPADD